VPEDRVLVVLRTVVVRGAVDVLLSELDAGATPARSAAVMLSSGV
jgi:hypothetical protein